ncbi:response regulator [Acetobacter oeni]|uniref:DNA-binding response regulator n=1 Tax=Acetobacter oeni TaxID=304077 RepID=A0A511XH79_9PROT|nr:response regulator [Acetobacter oeni]MBB3882436.1 two-component system phosphate regulon response regulator PhoB [Acetobacter oeni]NHO18470.1 response regulator [Acetobacter oeni]GBR00438.1 phosphate regulon response regulator PhoB [Acetobacter oeni LMG 21952]GEN62292.1 DNA-binding response regulator [Acetobacter oeni]
MSETVAAQGGTGARILLVEDDPSLQVMVRYNLEKAGYVVETAGDGARALDLAVSFRPALVLLDWMLPGSLSGIDVCRRLRELPGSRDVPVIMLTARSEEADAIRGLENGADDYLTKPCSMATLEARIRAMLRRVAGPSDVLEFDDIALDLVRHRVERGGRTLQLGPTEFRLLEFFMRRPGRVFSREDILKAIWGENIHVEVRTVDVHIRRLRKEINAPDERDLIRTVRSAGYALDNSAE